MNINVLLITADNIPKRNGSIYVLFGSGKSGKKLLVLNIFKTKALYRKKFYNIFYICLTVFFSVDKHTFQDHINVFRELTYCVVEDIYN